MSELGIDLTDLLDGTGVTAQDLIASAEKSQRGIGKAPVELTIMSLRDISREEVESVASASVGVNTTPPIKSLRDRHHKAARLLARGMSETQVATVTGYSVSRISILKNDPSFAELLETYRNQVDDIFINTVEKMKAVTDDALELLGERMETNPDSVTNTHLIEIVKTVGDRAGYSPVQKQVNVNIPIDTARLDAIKERAAQRQLGQVKTITQETINAEYKTLPSSAGTDVGEAIPSPQAVLEAPKA